MCSCVCSVEVSGMTNQLSFSEFRLFADLEFGVKRRRCDSLPKQVVLIELNYEIKIERNIINHKLFFTLALAFQQKTTMTTTTTASLVFSDQSTNSRACFSLSASPRNLFV